MNEQNSAAAVAAPADESEQGSQQGSAPVVRAKTGRPSGYSVTVADAVCGWLAGGKSLVTFCRQADAPSYQTVCRWLREDEAFRERYVRAREDQASYLAEEAVEIADTDDDSQRARVRLDARKWFAAKLSPKVYGDRAGLELSGPGGGPIKVDDGSKDRLLAKLGLVDNAT